MSKKVNLEKESTKTLEEFIQTEFDDMIKYADWRRGEQLRALIEKELKKKPKKVESVGVHGLA